MLYSRQEIALYMPHSGAMQLVDRVIEHGSGHFVAESDVGPHLPFYADGSVPAYIGIELMAQSVAAWSGIRRARPDSRPPLGYLLGTSRFESALSFFRAGSTLRTRGDQVVEYDGLAKFDCKMDLIDVDGVRTNVATANINVYSTSEKSAPKPT